MGMTTLLAGEPPAPNRVGFIPWVMRTLPLIPLLQVLGAALSLRRLRQWDRDPQLRPSRGRMWGQHILLPLIPDLSFMALLVYLIKSGVQRILHFFTPDVAWITLFCGTFSWIWSFVRTGLILRSLRKDA